MLTKIISGGQTGVDRAALDAALESGLPCGGWCPRGRRAEDGCLPARYPLSETASDSYAERTQRNVIESDGTLVIVRGQPTGGTKLTIELATNNGKPRLVLDVSTDKSESQILNWVRENDIRILNVAGPRESQATGIYEQARSIIRRFLELQRIL
jgi:predicted Rossmann fold nucleotide-binding protein DprA/Smf involved in DNA uptake